MKAVYGKAPRSSWVGVSRSDPVPAEMILWLCVIALPKIRKKNSFYYNEKKNY